MAKTPVAKQPWKPATAKILGISSKLPIQKKMTAQIRADGIEMKGARIVWELEGQEPALLANRTNFEFVVTNPKNYSLEAELQFLDGRRISRRRISLRARQTESGVIRDGVLHRLTHR